ncbi:type II toxin-antitoxin system prevent-host-death family antitoxin [uncultured Oscillibacter sp.]|uniref:type II toxin-antitoxin system prevent-host-death family antitoxin n=1 Tax=uncultured Oscillibacter sp. TaxID=876091 RepID=UPI0025CBB126|nr:type II toxin-antitoxin system prevent-host-death family antitoxin [uncultured Oscillibacter sp.]
MKEFKNLPPIDQMERISRTDLGNRLDEILDKVDKDDVGYVITDKGKDDLVLCPAHWFFTLDDDFGCIVNSAVRYAIGRYTYMPSTVMEFVRRHLDILDTRTITIMIEDIERELPDEKLYQRENWMSLRDDLKAQQKMLQHGTTINSKEKQESQ